MIYRIVILGLALFGTFATARAAQDDPAGFITAIYQRVAAGKGESGGGFVYSEPKDRQKYLSKALTKLWAEANAKTPKDDVGPIDFDPATNSQEPDVKAFKVTSERAGADKTTIAVTLTPRHSGWKNRADAVVRYDLIRENGRWVIDDIRGSNASDKWSVRGTLDDVMKNQTP
jgi:hypothetical protein